MGLSAGQLVAGRYRVGEPLGQGGCATVYAAVDEHLERDVALKVWPRGKGPLPDNPRQETRVAAGLAHSGVVVVHDAFSESDVDLLVMERVTGVSLAELLRDGPLTATRARHLVGQLLQALDFVHSQGLVHGDVKPGNVLIGPGDTVKLTDFGVAGAPRRSPTEVIGTPAYLSPEQVRGRTVTPATDVYATGLLLLECLVGKQSYPGSSAASATARLRSQPAVPEDVPADVAALVPRMTDQDPVRRPSAASAAATLERGGDRTVVLTGPMTVSLPRESRPPLLWLVVGAVLLAVLALAMTGPDPAPPTSPVAPTSTTGPTPTTVRSAPPSVRAPAVAPAPPGRDSAGNSSKGKGNGKGQR